VSVAQNGIQFQPFFLNKEKKKEKQRRHDKCKMKNKKMSRAQQTSEDGSYQPGMGERDWDLGCDSSLSFFFSLQARPYFYLEFENIFSFRV
jgi:hypothetical protein